MECVRGDHAPSTGNYRNHRDVILTRMWRDIFKKAVFTELWYWFAVKLLLHTFTSMPQGICGGLLPLLRVGYNTIQYFISNTK